MARYTPRQGTHHGKVYTTMRHTQCQGTHHDGFLAEGMARGDFGGYEGLGAAIDDVDGVPRPPGVPHLVVAHLQYRLLQIGRKGYRQEKI